MATPSGFPERSRQRDELARIVSEDWNALVLFASRFTKRQNAHDAVQEAVTRVLALIDEGRVESVPGALYAYLRSRAQDDARERARHPEVELTPETAAPERSDTGPSVTNRVVEEAAQSFRDPERVLRIFRAVYGEGRSMRSVAAEFGLKRGAVKTMLYRLRKYALEILERERGRS